MQGTEAIINKILTDAELKANEIEDKAKAYALNKKKEAEDWAENFVKIQNSELKKEAEEIINRRVIVANLDVRKLTLKHKQQLIGEVFDSVYKKMCSLNKKEYSSYVEKLLIENASVGDTIVLSKDGVLSSETVANFSVVKEKKMKISKTPGNFVGGIMLVGDKCDKDLSFKAIVEEKQSKLTLAVSEKLFRI